MSDEDKYEEMNENNEDGIADNTDAVENDNKNDTIIQKQKLRETITTLKVLNLIAIVLSIIIIMPVYFLGYMMIEGFSLFMTAFGAEVTTDSPIPEFILMAFLPFCILLITHFIGNKSLKELGKDLSKAGVFNYCALILHIIGIGLYALVLKSSEICTVYLIVDAIICLICFIITAKNTKSKLEDYSDIISINKY